MNCATKELIKRNIKLYFKDRATFTTSLISPIILLVLFVTFLGKVYSDSLYSFIPEGLKITDKIADSFTVSWLMSSLLGVSCVTVAFCSNIIMVQDRISGARNDLLASPIKKSQLALSYFIGNIITTGIVCLSATSIGLIYISTIGWYYTFTDILLIIADVIIAVLFGTSLAAVVDNFIKTQGGVGAISTLVSALYGFLCGAYMPISQFSETIRKALSLLPGTYCISLLRNHFFNGVLREMSETLPKELITGIRDGFDANIYVSGNKVTISTMYLVIGCTIVVLIALYVIINKIRIKKASI